MELAKHFNNNFNKFSDVPEAILAAGPKA